MSDRVAVIFHNLGPYHWARLGAAANYRAVIAIEEVAKSAEYAWESEGLGSVSNVKRIQLLREGECVKRPATQIAKRVRNVLEQERPAIVFIPGWSDPAGLGALLWALGANVPVVLISESTRDDEPRLKIREFLKQRIVRLSSAALVGGEPQREYGVELGLDAPAVFTGYDAVNNDYFDLEASRARTHADALRAKFDLPTRYFLASSRFLPRKNLGGILCAFAKYRYHLSASDAADLVVIGDGPLKTNFVNQANSLGVSQFVHFAGFRQYNELPVFYGLARGFVHAALREPWGLVVNEAMAAGLPVLVSTQTGCARNLVQDGSNGFVFDANDISELARLFSRIDLMSHAQRTALADAGKRVIAAYSIQNFAAQFERAATAAQQRGGRRATIFDKLLLRLLIRRYNRMAARLIASGVAK